MKSSFDYLPLVAIGNRICEDNFLAGIVGTPLWNAEKVIITEDWRSPGEGQLPIASRHGVALSWLFQELNTHTFFTELLDPEYFYRYLVKAVWRYQLDCLGEGNWEGISPGDRQRWEQALSLDSVEFSDSLCANPPSRAIAGTGHEEDSPIGLLAAVLAAVEGFFLKEFVELFVYGSLMRGESNHYLLENAEYLGEDAIADAELFNLGPYPMLVPGTGTVYGECYSIPLRIMPSLDRLEDHPHFYQRRWMQFESGKTRLVYQGFVSHVKGCPQILSGSWRNPHSIEGNPPIELT